LKRRPVRAEPGVISFPARISTPKSVGTSKMSLRESRCGREKFESIAREFIVRSAETVDLAINSAMRELAHELGLSETGNPDDAQQVTYSLEL
jgi:hypothetical protein